MLTAEDLGHNQPRLFCFGLGYSARALAAALVAEGWPASGTCRAAGTAARGARGIEAHVFDGERPLADAPAVLAGTTHLLVSAPPGAGGDPVLAWHRDDIAAISGLTWVGYLSTTGVYGDRGGGRVDEESTLAPTSDRARLRLAAESAWLDLWRGRGVPVHIFRLAGIYGPGRSVLDRLRAGDARRVDKPGHVFSRIHVDDIVAVLRASMSRPNPGAVYNVCDDGPAPQAEVVAHAAKLLGMEPPPLVPIGSAGLSPMAQSFYADNKRVRNDRIKTELGVQLKYPDYKSGLAAILALPHPAAN